MSAFNEIFALTAYWLGVLILLTSLVLLLLRLMWIAAKEIYGWPRISNLLIATRHAGGIEKAIEKLKATP